MSKLKVAQVHWYAQIWSRITSALETLKLEGASSTLNDLILPSSTKADHLKMLSRFQIDDRRKELQISHQAVCFAAMSTRIKAYISCSLYNGIKEKRYS
jgi:hypothetical protein